MPLHRLSTLLRIASILWTLGASAQAQTLTSLSEAQVLQICRSMFRSDALAISIGPTAVKFSFDGMNNRQITDFVNNHGGKTKGAMGMTKYAPDYRFITKRNVLAVPVEGRWCYRDEIHLEMARQPVEVHISSDYRHNQCIQRAIHEHEMAHVNVFHSYLRYVATTLQDLYGTGVGQIRTSRTPPVREPEDQNDRITAIREAIDQAIPRMNEIHEEVDTGTEVRRFWADLAACEKPAARTPDHRTAPAPVPTPTVPARSPAPAPARAPAPTRAPAGPAALF